MNPPLLVRRFHTDITQPDPHTLTGRAVPYDTPAEVVDMRPDGSLDVYHEGFRAGAFDHAMTEPARITLVDGHHPDGTTGEKMGIATELRSTPAGLEVDFRLLTEAHAEKVRTMVDVGVADLSVGFAALRGGTVIDRDGTRWRTRALLRHVALEPEGAYPGAEVLAMRADEEEASRADDDYQTKLDELAEWLEHARAKQAEYADLVARRKK